MICFTFPENAFNFVSHKFAKKKKKKKKKEKCSFQTLRTCVFELKVASKPLPKKLPIEKFLFK